MKNFSSNFISSSVSARFLYKNKNKENLDAHGKISKGVRVTSEAPFNVANYVSDKVHNVLETTTAHIPLVGKPLSYIPSASKKIVKGVLNTGKNIVGGVAEGASQGATHVVEGAGKVVTKTGKGTIDAGKSIIGKKETLSKRENKDLAHGKNIREKVSAKRKARKAKRKERRAQKQAKKAA